MDWLRHRIGTGRGRRSSEPEAIPNRDPSWPLERASPGVAHLLSHTGKGRDHSVLDLGPAAGSSFRVFRGFARRIRFVDFPGEAGLGPSREEALEALPPEPEQPYDLLFTWDVLDRILPEARPRVVERLTEISAPKARLHIVVHPAEVPHRLALRFALMDQSRVRCEPTTPPHPVRTPLLPAEVQRLLAPFRVERAFTLRSGLREYVAVREAGS